MNAWTGDCDDFSGVEVRPATRSSAAERDGTLTLLALDRIAGPGRPELDGDDDRRAERGRRRDVATLLWRALGFPDVPDGEPRVHRRVGRGVAPDQRALRRRRSSPTTTPPTLVGAGPRGRRQASREWPRRCRTRSSESVFAARGAGARRRGRSPTAVDRGARLVDCSTRLIDYALRVQVRAAVWRKLLTPQLASGEIPRSRSASSISSGTPRSARSSTATSWPRSSPGSRRVTYDTVAQLGGAAGEDDRRRGDVRRRGPGGRGCGSRSRSPTEPASTTSCPAARAGVALRTGVGPGRRLLRLGGEPRASPGRDRPPGHR